MMNLITCSEDCEYQIDGYCGLDSPTLPPQGKAQNPPVGGCSYFQPKRRAKKTGGEQKRRH